MTELPTALYRTAQVRELDRVAIQEFAIPGYTLMQRAGQAAFKLLRTRWPEARKLRVIAGTGNNGGDGYVLALCARQAGLDILTLQCGDAGRIRGDARTARAAYLAAGGEEQPFADEDLSLADVIVDALLGTGLEQEVRDNYKAVIEAINAQPTPVLALDVPSGLHSDTGMPLGAAVEADCTISFIGLKRGLFTGHAADYCGELHFDDLQVPAEIYQRQEPAAQRVDLAMLARLLAPRARSSHKGHFGHVLILGGERGMGGAPRMAGEAAARVGAGLVSVATRAANVPAINATRPELMAYAVEDRAELAPLLRRATVVAIGPGLGTTAWSRSLLSAVLDADLPKIIDADGLNLLSAEPLRREDWVLTPHPGEAGRLLGCDTRTVQNDRYGALQGLQQRYGGVCLLKGAGTLIGSSRRVAVCTAGNPGMASGGMGDVLTGVVAGLRAQGLANAEAAELGACLHAAAADCAAKCGGERGLLATDLFEHLRRLANP
jgi:ADP-dependent NAD(P)H-hydrate dehydratase / NAD(P)H-hydrate epimerase